MNSNLPESIPVVAGSTPHTSSLSIEARKALEYQKLHSYLIWLLQQWDVPAVQDLHAAFAFDHINFPLSDLHSLHQNLEKLFTEDLSPLRDENLLPQDVLSDHLLRCGVAKLRSGCVRCVRGITTQRGDLMGLISPCPLPTAFERSLQGLLNCRGYPSPQKVAEQRYQYLGPVLDGIDPIRKDVYNHYPKTRRHTAWPTPLFAGQEDPAFDASRVCLYGKRYLAHWHPGAPAAVRTSVQQTLTSSPGGGRVQMQLQEPSFSVADYLHNAARDGIRVIVCLSEPKARRNYLEPVYWAGGDFGTSSGERVSVTLLHERHLRTAEGYSDLEFISLRRLRVTIAPALGKEGDEKEQPREHLMYHCHYRNWQDGNVPLHLRLFKRFLRVVWGSHVASGDPSSPIAVHCSAGWGRSGIFIWCHSLLQQYRATFAQQTQEDDTKSPASPPSTETLSRTHEEPPKPENIDIGLTWRKLLSQRELIQNPFQFAFCASWTHSLANSPHTNWSSAEMVDTQEEAAILGIDDERLLSLNVGVEVTEEDQRRCYEVGAGWLSEEIPSSKWVPVVDPRIKRWLLSARDPPALLRSGDEFSVYVWQIRLEKNLTPQELEIVLNMPFNEVGVSLLQDLLTSESTETKISARAKLRALCARFQLS